MNFLRWQDKTLSTFDLFMKNSLETWGIRCQLFASRMRRQLLVKFGLSEHSKFDKIFPLVLTNQLIYYVNVKTTRKIFSKFVCFSESPNFICVKWRNVLDIESGSNITLIYMFFFCRRITICLIMWPDGFAHHSLTDYM